MSIEPKILYIYVLKHEDLHGDDVTFYVGKSHDPKSREKEHVYSSKKGLEDKYTRIRQLENEGLRWWSETVIETNPSRGLPQDYERYYVIHYARLNCPLTNMKHGDLDNAEEIKNATQLFDNLIIRVFQDQVIECIDAILSVNDIALDLYFKTLKPIEFSDIDVLETKEVIEEETGYEMSKVNLKMIDGVEAYKTIEEAEEKALEEGCEGYHEHEMDGEIWYMACESHEVAVDLKKPCTAGYEQYGMKNKNGKQV